MTKTQHFRIKFSQIIFFSLVFFTLISLLNGRIIMPTVYLSVYFFVYVFTIINIEKIMKNAHKEILLLFLFFSLFFIYSLSFVEYKLSSLIYYLMWISNVLVVFAILYIKNLEKLLDLYLKFVLLLSLTGLFFYVLGLSDTSNPLYTLNKNAYVFLVIPALSIALFKKKLFIFYTIAFASIFVYSRTLYIILFIIFVYLVYKRSSFKDLIYYFLFISIVFIVFYFIFQDSYLLHRITNGFELLNNIFIYFNTYDLTMFNKSEEIRRLGLLAANVDIVVKTFPYGTGLGLENYLSYFSQDFINTIGVPGRTHNFYVSYIGEMGIFYFIFLFIIFRPIFLSSDKYFKAAYLGLLVAILVNEYITTPFFWIIYGLVIRFHYQKSFLVKEKNL